ncbi:hypothetical protein SAMN05421854_104291 [Amycolatopsis rubida]|uniref:Uncharacterized protein n=1 Tax=Amycolatopsis rubida TaxID=112413 RepID=A0A1I5N7W7_9PSEU|nr:hypothetical protein SAMN05421854_104291 [Amycolatopsis rubida]
MRLRSPWDEPCAGVRAIALVGRSSGADDRSSWAVALGECPSWLGVRPARMGVGGGRSFGLDGRPGQTVALVGWSRVPGVSGDCPGWAGRRGWGIGWRSAVLGLGDCPGRMVARLGRSPGADDRPGWAVARFGLGPGADDRPALACQVIARGGRPFRSGDRPGQMIARGGRLFRSVVPAGDELGDRGQFRRCSRGWVGGGQGGQRVSEQFVRLGVAPRSAAGFVDQSRGFGEAVLR